VVVDLARKLPGISTKRGGGMAGTIHDSPGLGRVAPRTGD
jgi:hypothetical protein